MRIRAATRGSALALWQTRHVASLLAPAGVEVEEVVVSTSGDRRQDIPIHEMGGKGVFVKEVQAALLDAQSLLPPAALVEITPRIDGDIIFLEGLVDSTDTLGAVVQAVAAVENVRAVDSRHTA